ncbi:MAG: hypothetical protein HZA24_06015 [Nitrospirae bacterium]|nr:hypothetical protein [Nitrospirota bacterium]
MAIPRLLMLIALLLAAPLAVPAQTAGFAVVAHRAVPVDALSAAELRRVFLKKQTHWADGTPIAVVEMTGDPALREGFYGRILNSTVERMTAYWINETMTHAVAPPRLYGTAAMLLDYVARTPGAIGFVPAGTPLPPEIKHLEMEPTP